MNTYSMDTAVMEQGGRDLLKMNCKQLEWLEQGFVPFYSRHWQQGTPQSDLTDAAGMAIIGVIPANYGPVGVDYSLTDYGAECQALWGEWKSSFASALREMTDKQRKAIRNGGMAWGDRNKPEYRALIDLGVFTFKEHRCEMKFPGLKMQEMILEEIAERNEKGAKAKALPPANPLDKPASEYKLEVKAEDPKDSWGANLDAKELLLLTLVSQYGYIATTELTPPYTRAMSHLQSAGYVTSSGNRWGSQRLHSYQLTRVGDALVELLRLQKKIAPKPRNKRFGIPQEEKRPILVLPT